MASHWPLPKALAVAARRRHDVVDEPALVEHDDAARRQSPSSARRPTACRAGRCASAPRGRAAGSCATVTAPVGSSVRSSAERKRVTWSWPCSTMTSRRSESSCSVRVAVPAGRGQSSRADRRRRRRGRGRWSRRTPRRAAPRRRRGARGSCPSSGAIVTSAPPRRSATCARPAASIATRPGSSPFWSATVNETVRFARSTT